jgi:flavorubredoxin
MDVPVRACETEIVAPDTHLIRLLFGEGAGPVATYVNSMVITGAEPVIVDCGPAVVRSEWTEKVFEVVDPSDVRWIYLSHDDADHTGNLAPVLELCPQATLVTNWFMVERMAADGALPLDRMRWINDGESFDAGDRELVAVVPPTFDSPTTRGLFDPESGNYWAADSCGTPVTHEVRDIAELDPGFFRDGFLQMQRILSPWHQWLDPARYGEHLDRVRAIGASTITSAHGPALHGEQIFTAFELLHELPHLGAAVLPGAAELEQMVAAFTAPVAAAV